MQVEKISCSKMDKDKTVQTAQVAATSSTDGSNTPKVTEASNIPKKPQTSKSSNQPNKSTVTDSSVESPNPSETPKKSRRSRRSHKTPNTNQINPENSETPNPSEKPKKSRKPPRSRKSRTTTDSNEPNPEVSETPISYEAPENPRRSRRSRKSRNKPKDSNAKTPYQGARRCFAMFRCPVATCERFWCSACSWANIGQQCRDCATGEMVYPFSQRPLLRRKDKKQEEEEEGEEDYDKKEKEEGEEGEGNVVIEVKKPHHRHLCEKCIRLRIDCSLPKNSHRR